MGRITVTDDSVTRRIASTVARVALTQLEGESLVNWHTFALERCYISDSDLFELGIRLSRSWDTNMTFSLRSNADESADRLTDRTIDAIRMTVRRMLDDKSGEHHFSDNEYITYLNIRRFEERTGAPADEDCFSYTVEYRTTTEDSLVVQDERVAGNHRVAGRRLLVRDVWYQFVGHRSEQQPPQEPYEALAEEYNNIITPEEAEEIVGHARARPETFEEPEEILDGDESFSPL